MNGEIYYPSGIETNLLTHCLIAGSEAELWEKKHEIFKT